MQFEERISTLFDFKRKYQWARASNNTTLSHQCSRDTFVPLAPYSTSTAQCKACLKLCRSVRTCSTYLTMQEETSAVRWASAPQRLFETSTKLPMKLRSNIAACSFESRSLHLIRGLIRERRTSYWRLRRQRIRSIIIDRIIIWASVCRGIGAH